MTREELAQFDGREGRKAYVAVNGSVYDLTGSKLWPAGEHEGQHQAGCDLSEDIKAAPHVRAVVERFPVVGKLEDPALQAAGGGGKWIAVAAIIIVIILAFLLLR